MERIVCAVFASRDRQVLQVRGIGQSDRGQRGSDRPLRAEMQFPHVPAARKIQLLQIADVVKLDRKRCVTDRTAQHGQRLQPHQVDGFESGVVTQVETRSSTVFQIQPFEIAEIGDPLQSTDRRPRKITYRGGGQHLLLRQTAVLVLVEELQAVRSEIGIGNRRGHIVGPDERRQHDAGIGLVVGAAGKQRETQQTAQILPREKRVHRLWI